MNDYLLSICIPTANRKKELTEQLNKIIVQMGKLENNLVQIVICDNTDNDEQLIDIDFFDYQYIKYIKNISNVGYAKNINNVIRNADGEFLWLLSDDDFVFENAVKIIIDSLLKNKNANYITFECGGTFNGELFSEKMYFKDIDSLYYQNGRDFLNQYWNSVIFISINIFNKTKVLEHINKYKLFDNINEVYQNSLIGITFIDQCGEVLVIKDSLLNDNYGNKVYAPENINNVAVDKYYKLLKQLRDFNAPIKVLSELANQIYGNIVHYGFYSIVYNIEYEKINSYPDIYKKIFKDNKNSIKMRTVSFIIYLLLVSNNSFSKLCLKFILLIKRSGNADYRKIKEEVDAMVKNSKSKIASTY